jgi:hypothetical protein
LLLLLLLLLFRFVVEMYTRRSRQRVKSKGGGTIP